MASHHDSSRSISFFLLGLDVNGSPKSSSVFLKASGFHKHSEKFTWIELKNSKGKAGWLYGSSDFICVETSNSYILCPRASLLNFVHDRVDFTSPIVSNPWQARYKIFQRDSFEEITQVSNRDILSLKDVQVWEKQ